MKIFLSKEMGHVNVPHITFFDLETTTKEPATAELLTGYFRTVDAQTKNVIDELHVKMKPLKWIKESYEFHGLSESLCSTFPDKKVMMREIFRYLIKYQDTLLICHANYTTFGIKGYFDWQVIKKECLYMDVLHHFNERFSEMILYSTHTIARDRKLPVRNYGLASLAKFIGETFKHHDCVEDTIVTEKLFWWLINQKTLLDYMEEN